MRKKEREREKEKETGTSMGTSSIRICVWVCGRGSPWGLPVSWVLVEAVGLVARERETMTSIGVSVRRKRRSIREPGSLRL